MALTQVTHVLLDARKDPREGVAWKATLIAPYGYLTGSNQEIIAPAEGVTAADGLISMWLTPVSEIEFAGAVYQLTWQGQSREQSRFFTVPNTGPVNLRAVLTTAPSGGFVTVPVSGPYPVSASSTVNGIVFLMSDGSSLAPVLASPGAAGPPGPPGGGNLNAVSATGGGASALSTAEALSGQPHIPSGVTRVVADTDITMTKPLSFGVSGLLSPSTGRKVTLAGVTAPRGQQLFASGFGGLIRFKPNALGEIPAEWFLPPGSMNLSTFDSAPGLRKAAEAAADVTTVPPTGVYGADYMGGTIVLPRGPMWIDGPVEVYHQVGVRGQGRGASEVNALSAGAKLHAYDPRGNYRGSPIRDLTFNGRNVATYGIHLERTVAASVRNCSVINAITNLYLDGAQQTVIDNVDLLKVTGGTITNLLIDRSSRNMLATGGTWKNADYGIYITQSTLGVTDGGSADSIIRPSGITVAGTVIENQRLHNIVVDAGSGILFRDGPSSGAGNGIVGDPGEKMPPIRIAGRLEPVAVGQPASTSRNRVQVTFDNWDINGTGAAYGIDARVGVDLAGNPITATAKPRVDISIRGRKSWTATTALVLADEHGVNVSPDQYVKGTNEATPMVALTAAAVTAGKVLLDVLDYRAGVVALPFTGAVGDTSTDALPIPPGSYEILSFVVRTPANVTGTALSVDLKRNGVSVWVTANRAAVSVGASIGRAGVPILAQAILGRDDAITVSGTGPAAQRFTALLTLRALP